MPSRASTPKRPRDINLHARSVVEDLIGEKMDGSPLPVDTRNPAAVALSKLGASKGGKARAASLGDTKRKSIAKKAARPLHSAFEIYRAFPANAQLNAALRGPNDAPLFFAAGDGSPFAKLVPNVTLAQECHDFAWVP